MHDLPLNTLTDLAQWLRAGETTSEAIVRDALARIAALDGQLHAFVEVYADAALAAARAADLEREAGLVRGPLHGLPIALKDLIDLEGRMTTAGSKAWPRRAVARATAPAAQRLIDAGMIPLGKTHMVEFAFGGWGRNQPMGAPWNPWDLAVHRVAGGSSSGSAVAVAAGFAPAAIGSDTGGSIRIPAALCNLTGLKPTYGRISLAGVVPLSTTLDSLGPLARSVEDAALLTAAMAGPDPADPSTLAVPALSLDDALRGEPDLRGIALAALDPAQFPDYTEDAVVQAFDAALRALRDLGARVDVVRAPFDFNDVMVRNGLIIAAEAYRLHRDYIEDEALEIDPWVRRRMLGGKGITAADYLDELAARREAAAAFAGWMRGRAALVTPTLPITATPLDAVDEATTPLAAFTRAANYLGACALTLPAGFSGDGLPVGVQLLGAPFAEASLVTVGRAFQRTTDWHRRQPQLAR